MRRPLTLPCRWLSLGAALIAAAPQAQAYPERTVSIVVPYSPGGGHDAMARIVAERLSKRLGQAVIVENKAGANGMVGTEFVTRAAPDGYTILFASPAEIVIAPSAYKAMRYDPVKDLASVTLAATTPLVLVANPSLGVHTLTELIALAKRKPGTLSFGTSGNATSQHLAGVWLNSLAGIDERRSRTKPRTSGLSTVIDDGLPLAYAQSVVETAAPYIDLMKIKTGTARLYARPQLEAKLAMYRAAQVRPFDVRAELREARQHRRPDDLRYRGATGRPGHRRAAGLSLAPA